ncbi:hypothetical protein B0H17DRAFT_1187868 [Mycena rosella]|uniref:Uncharacterized protein n=1 Tax=Mycena rosella TaxID=1033263 RepID=A0AAD7BSK1_MYCRO|nr:hypothetical protein B0H17DRAFT_1187868 [Mycena rosella]
MGSHLDALPRFSSASPARVALQRPEGQWRGFGCIAGTRFWGCGKRGKSDRGGTLSVLECTHFLKRRGSLHSPLDSGLKPPRALMPPPLNSKAQPCSMFFCVENSLASTTPSSSASGLCTFSDPSSALSSTSSPSLCSSSARSTSAGLSSPARGSSSASASH